MLNLLLVLIISLFLAHISERKQKLCEKHEIKYKLTSDAAYIALIAVLTVFAGLRTSYNDTNNYINGFKQAADLKELFSSGDLSLFTNPAFKIFQSFLKQYSTDPQILIFITSLFTQISFVRFIKRYSTNFVLSIFIYFTLGTYLLTLAAIKQVVAMSIVAFAIPQLEKKHYLRYIILVISAFMFHTYAILFIALVFFKEAPWKKTTLLLVAILLIVMANFDGFINSFIDTADDLGKNIDRGEVLKDAGMNIFRVLVYLVVPAITFIYRKKMFANSSYANNILAFMSIISGAFMVLATNAGANMFGRMGNYFEIGTVVAFPWIINNAFDKKTAKSITYIACACFFMFFIYANVINMDFSKLYKSISLMDFLF